MCHKHGGMGPAAGARDRAARLGELAGAPGGLAVGEPGGPEGQVAAEPARGALVDEVHAPDQGVVRQRALRAQAQRVPPQPPQVLQLRLVINVPTESAPSAS